MRVITCISLILGQLISAVAQNIVVSPLPVNTSIRGMAVADNNLVWISGSNGYVGLTRDGGKTWQMQQVPGYDNAEFRDIHLMQDGSVILMSATLPAAILRSADKGATWQEIFRQDDPAYFLDAMDFHGDRGMCLGDPINGHFLTLYTEDAGWHWQERFLDDIGDSLAAFAASGSIVKYLTRKKILFATGGKEARVYYTGNGGKSWAFSPTDIHQGKPSSGIFTMAFCNKKTLIVGGGDYTTGATPDNNLEALQYRRHKWWSTKEWQYDLAASRSLGYISCLSCGANDVLIACGTGGVGMISERYRKISDIGFHVVQCAPDGITFYLAGNAVFGVCTIPVKQ